jgi:hypothetical protein
MLTEDIDNIHQCRLFDPPLVLPFYDKHLLPQSTGMLMLKVSPIDSLRTIFLHQQTNPSRMLRKANTKTQSFVSPAVRVRRFGYMNAWTG